MTAGRVLGAFIIYLRITVHQHPEAALLKAALPGRSNALSSLMQTPDSLFVPIRKDLQTEP